MKPLAQVNGNLGQRACLTGYLFLFTLMLMACDPVLGITPEVLPAASPTAALEVLLASPTPVSPVPTVTQKTTPSPFIQPTQALPEMAPTIDQVKFGEWDHVLAVDWSPDGQSLAVAAGRYVYIYRYPEMEEIQRLFTGASSSSVKFQPDSPDIHSLLAVGGKDGTLQAWNYLTGELLCSFKAHKLGTNRTVFSPDGRNLASSGMDAMIRFWDLNSLYEQEAGSECRLPMVAEMIGGARAVPDLAFHPLGNMIASIDQRWIRVREPDTQRLVYSLSAGKPVYALGFTPAGTYLVTAEGGVEVRLWDVETWQVYTELKSEDKQARPVNAFAWSLSIHPDGKLIAVGASDSTITVWNGRSGWDEVSIFTLEGHSRAVACLAFSPDGTVLASGSLDGSLRLWFLETP